MPKPPTPSDSPGSPRSPSPSTAPRPWPPIITSGPIGTTAGGDTFAFTGESGATFQCRLDTGVWSTCASPKTLGALADGSHTFDVRAVDAAGNISPVASRTWTVDGTGPTFGTTFPVAGGRYGTTKYNAGCAPTTGEVCGTTSDASGVAQVEISVQRASTGLYLSGTTFGQSGPGLAERDRHHVVELRDRGHHLL